MPAVVQAETNNMGISSSEFVRGNPYYKPTPITRVIPHLRPCDETRRTIITIPTVPKVFDFGFTSAAL
jgi:hypothetical protein